MCRSVVNGFFAATAAVAAGGRWAEDGVTVWRGRTRKNNYDQPNGHINMDTGRGRPGLQTTLWFWPQLLFFGQYCEDKIYYLRCVLVWSCKVLEVLLELQTMANKSLLFIFEYFWWAENSSPLVWIPGSGRWLLELVAGSHAGADIRGKSAHLCPSGMWPPRPPQYLHFNIAAATKSEYREFGIIFI